MHYHKTILDLPNYFNMLITLCLVDVLIFFCLQLFVWKIVVGFYVPTKFMRSFKCVVILQIQKEY